MGLASFPPGAAVRAGAGKGAAQELEGKVGSIRGEAGVGVGVGTSTSTGEEMEMVGKEKGRRTWGEGLKSVVRGRGSTWGWERERDDVKVFV